MNSSYIDSNKPEDLAQLFPLVKNNLNSIKELIDNLLEWSRSTNDVNLTKVKLKDLILEICSLFKGNALEKNIDINYETLNNEMRVFADAAMLRFILRNLINNAIKFTENGEIRIEAEKTDSDKVKIKVIDSGIGIPKDLLERIKLKDRKVSTKGTRNEKGTGLGLQLIREFLSIHKSELDIESKENKGSIFSFELPLA